MHHPSCQCLPVTGYQNRLPKPVTTNQQSPSNYNIPLNLRKSKLRSALYSNLRGRFTRILHILFSTRLIPSNCGLWVCLQAQWLPYVIFSFTQYGRARANLNWAIMGNAITHVQPHQPQFDLINNYKIKVEVIHWHGHRSTINCLNSVSSLLSWLWGPSWSTTAGIQITWGIIKTKTSGSFLGGFLVIKGQFHWGPHQDYCWCDTLVSGKCYQ